LWFTSLHGSASFHSASLNARCHISASLECVMSQSYSPGNGIVLVSV
jgi:hypothetical protein